MMMAADDNSTDTGSASLHPVQEQQDLVFAKLRDLPSLKQQVEAEEAAVEFGSGTQTASVTSGDDTGMDSGDLDSLAPLLQKLAASGTLIYPWLHTKKYLGIELRLKMRELLMKKGWQDPAVKVGIRQGGPADAPTMCVTYKERIVETLKMLDSFDTDPPFTIQRLAEILLESDVMVTHKAIYGVQKVLSVESTTDGDETFLEQHDADFLPGWVGNVGENHEEGKVDAQKDPEVGSKRNVLKEDDGEEKEQVKRLRPEGVEQPEPVLAPFQRSDSQSSSDSSSDGLEGNGDSESSRT